MAPSVQLEAQDKARDAAFNKAMHGTSATATGGFSAMMKKDKVAQKAAVDEYFKHWDNKAAKDETAADREACFTKPATKRNAKLTALRLATRSTLRSQDSMIAHSLTQSNALLMKVVTIIWARISTNMVGANLSISAASHTVNPFTKPLPATNTTSRPKLALRMEIKF
jgi:hypothetical protein